MQRLVGCRATDVTALGLVTFDVLPATWKRRRGLEDRGLSASPTLGIEYALKQIRCHKVTTSLSI